MAVIKGYMKCERCGTIFTPSIVESPCMFQDETIPSEACAVCLHFKYYMNGNPKCPACGTTNVKKISGISARLSNYFRK